MKNGHAPRARRRTAAVAAETPSWQEILAPARRMADVVPGLTQVPSRRTLRRLQRTLPARALEATGTLAWRLRELTGHDVIDLETLQDMLGLAFRAGMVRSAHHAGEYEIDEFGFEPLWAEIWLPLVRLLYRRYWRVDAEGMEHVPRTGAALLVSNHAGVFPWDAAMIKVAVYDNVYDRHVRALVADWLMATPGLSWFMRRTGQTIGNPDDTHRLLTHGNLVLVFPEGVRGTGKPFSERYRLRRFGRGGYVEAAVRAGVPVIPISVMGSEETYPMIGNIEPLARLMGVPYFPVTPALPWLGPLGLVPLPSKWRIRFHPPVRTDEMPSGVALDRGRMLEISDSIRDTIQAGLVEMLGERRTVIRG